MYTYIYFKMASILHLPTRTGIQLKEIVTLISEDVLIFTVVKWRLGTFSPFATLQGDIPSIYTEGYNIWPCLFVWKNIFMTEKEWIGSDSGRIKFIQCYNLIENRFSPTTTVIPVLYSIQLILYNWYAPTK